MSISLNSRMRWHLVACRLDSDAAVGRELSELLEGGWEPFGGSYDHVTRTHTIYLRMLVPVPE